MYAILLAARFVTEVGIVGGFRYFSDDGYVMFIYIGFEEEVVKNIFSWDSRCNSSPLTFSLAFIEPSCVTREPVTDSAGNSSIYTVGLHNFHYAFFGSSN